METPVQDVRLPPEMWCHVFTYLDDNVLLISCTVSKDWLSMGRRRLYASITLGPRRTVRRFMDCMNAALPSGGAALACIRSLHLRDYNGNISGNPSLLVKIAQSFINLEELKIDNMDFADLPNAAHEALTQLSKLTTLSLLYSKFQGPMHLLRFIASFPLLTSVEIGLSVLHEADDDETEPSSFPIHLQRLSFGGRHWPQAVRWFLSHAQRLTCLNLPAMEERLFPVVGQFLQEAGCILEHLSVAVAPVLLFDARLPQLQRTFA